MGLPFLVMSKNTFDMLKAERVEAKERSRVGWNAIKEEGGRGG
jgi:hypothetical protein